MKTCGPVYYFFPALLAIFLGIACLAETAATQSEKSDDQSPTVNHANGLKVVTFPVKPGKIKVYLPDDMAAGDTISGSLEPEPSGTTQEERAKNRELLDKFTLDLEGVKADVKQQFFIWEAPEAGTNAPVRYKLSISDGASSYDYVLETDSEIKARGGEWTSESRTNHPDFLWYPLGQQGRPNVIYGPFDGRFGTTLIKIGQQVVRLLAESPRKSVFQSSYDLVGPTQLTLKEGSVDATGNYRNLSVSLSAPKTNLLRGERTTLTVEVGGLEGIQKDVPLQLDSKGVITMEAGNFQNLRITPAEVNQAGRYSVTRAITGQQAGAFTVTATVIVGRYDMKLQDDIEPARRVFWNTFTGDYFFTAGGAPLRPGGQPPSGGTTSPGGARKPPMGGTSLSGTGKPAMKGCIITLQHNAPDRRVFARLDVCNKTGDASVETTSPKTKVTITDKNTTDNPSGSN